MIGIGLDDFENVGGFLEVEEVLVEIGALGKEVVEVEVESALIGDALVEETRHGANVG